MATINLDSARAARSEAEKTPHTIIRNTKEFSIPARMPIRASLAADKGDVLSFLQLLLGDQYEDFMEGEDELDDLDFQEIGNGLGAAYGVEMGESQASGVSSKNTGKRSRRTSKGTESTSQMKSGVPAKA